MRYGLTVYYSLAVSRNSTLTYLEATSTCPLLFSRSAEAASTERREIAQCLEAYSNCAVHVAWLCSVVRSAYANLNGPLGLDYVELLLSLIHI